MPQYQTKATDKKGSWDEHWGGEVNPKRSTKQLKYPSSNNQEMNYCKEKMTTELKYRSDGNHAHPCGGDVKPKDKMGLLQQSFPPPPSILITITCKFCKKEYTKCKNAFAACPHCNNFQ